MKLTAKIKLTPSPEQHQSLLLTLRAANAACNFISEQAWAVRRFGRSPVHHLTYRVVREIFLLGAQIAIRCIGKVVDAYKANQKVQATFQPHGGIAYDSHNLKYYLQKQTVSIWTLDGRLVIPFQAGEYQLDLLMMQQGESDLAHIRGAFYLFATCEVEAPQPVAVTDMLGVDMGVTNLAVDSDGDFHRGNHITSVRCRQQRLRRRLQKKRTRSATRRLRHLAGKEYRFANDVNHCISKRLVKKAEHTKRGIAIEALKGIRARMRVKKPGRYLLHSWSFGDLQLKLAYKAKRKGIPVITVNPAYTSQMCSCCGHTEKYNRASQSSFLCKRCGFVSHADYNAALNIRQMARIQRGGAVNHPDAAAEQSVSCKPPASAGGR
jgi:putative transposase